MPKAEELSSPVEEQGPLGFAGPEAAADPDELRYRRIALAAYYRAERRGFAPDGALDDWLAAEQEEEAQRTGEAPAGNRDASAPERR